MKNHREKHENPPRNFYSMVPIIDGIDSYLAKSKYHLTIKKSCMYAFLRSPDSLGLAARL